MGERQLVSDLDRRLIAERDPECRLEVVGIDRPQPRRKDVVSIGEEPVAPQHLFGSEQVVDVAVDEGAVVVEVAITKHRDLVVADEAFLGVLPDGL